MSFSPGTIPSFYRLKTLNHSSRPFNLGVVLFIRLRRTTLTPVLDDYPMFFVTAHLGEPHGSAKSARDFARSLLAHCKNTNIVCPKKESFEHRAAGYDLFVPIWHQHGPSKANQFRRRGIVSRKLQEAKTHLAYRSLRKKIHKDVVVVNGWGSIRFWRSLDAVAQRSALIVRESPRHFQCADRDIPMDRFIAELANFDMLIFVSRILQGEWMQIAELSMKPSFYFPNCCEEEEIATVTPEDCGVVRSELGLKESDYMIICPGAIEQRKGQDIVLRRWFDILEKVPTSRLLILGNATTEFGRSIVRDVNAGKYGVRITYLDAAPSAIPYLSAADLLLFPSRAEALPRTILEAMAAGKPTIATSVDGIPELIDHDRSGWLFEPDDDNAMVAGIVAAANDRRKAAAWAVAAKRRYQEKFSRRCQVERMRDLLLWMKI